MITHDRDMIQRRALKGNAIDFLKSEEVAKAVAARFKVAIGQMPPGYLKVGESARHPGTWRVGFDLVARVEVSYLNRQLNVSESRRVTAAFQAAFRTSDLVTTYTHDRRSR